MKREKELEAFERLLNIMDDLREKCPWDRKQTLDSLRPNTIEETYELADAILAHDMHNIAKELGDLLLHIVFYAKIGSETGDFDIALYCMIADKAGDPYYCIDALFRQDSRWAVAGFRSDECESLINALQYETDAAKRASLANQIVQQVLDEHAFGFVGLFNKTTVTAKGVSGISENCPFDFYELTADSDKQ